MRRFGGALLLLSLAASPCAALECVGVEWNSSRGAAVINRVNILSVLLSNDGEADYEGFITLRCEDATGIQAGPLQVQPAYISAGGRRWVQFHPFIGDGNATFRLSWGRGLKDAVDLPQLQVGGPARVMLVEAKRSGPLVTAAKTVQDDLWPESSAALSVFASIILDHDPSWSAPQRQALRDWVYRGGELHILRREDGELPKLTGPLAELLSAARTASRPGAGDAPPQPVTTTVFGGGLIVLHERKAFELDIRDFSALGFPEARERVPPKYNNQTGETEGGEVFFEDALDLAVLGRLRLSLPRPETPWVGLLLLGGLYIVIIGPVNLVIGKLVRNPRVSYIVLVSSIAAFSGLFLVLGQRGYDEEARLHTVQIARCVSPAWGDAPARFDVQSWNQVFLTQSRRLTITQASPWSAFGVTSNSATQGLIQSGPGGQLVTEIPLFSNRGYAAAGQLSSPPLFAAEPELLGSSEHPRVRFREGPGFPEDARVLVVSKGKIHGLERQPDGVYQAGGTMSVYDEEYGYSFTEVEGEAELSAFLGTRAKNYYGGSQDTWDQLLATQQYRDDYSYDYGYQSGRYSLSKFLRPLVARALEAVEPWEVDPRASGEAVDLLIWGRGPDEWAPEGWIGGTRNMTLFHIRLRRSSQP